MDSFLIVLPFSVVIISLAAIYTSPMTHIEGRSFIKVLIRVPLFFLIFGGIAEQENYLSQHEALHVRSFYEATLALVDLFPMYFLMIYRYRHDLKTRASAPIQQKQDRDLQEDVRVVRTNYLADGSFRAEILPPRNRAAYKLMALVFVLGISVIAASHFFVERQVALLPSSPRIAVYHFAQIVVSLVALFCLTELLTGKQILTMSHRELWMQHVLLGITGRARKFENRHIVDLHFSQWQVASGHGLKKCSGLSFQVGPTRETFGTTLTEAQVDDLITKMRGGADL